MLKTKVALASALLILSFNGHANDGTDITVQELDALKAMNEIKQQQARAAQFDLQQAQVRTKMLQVQQEQKAILQTPGKKIGDGTVTVNPEDTICFASVHSGGGEYKADVSFMGRTLRGVERGHSLGGGFTIASINYAAGIPAVNYETKDGSIRPASSCSTQVLSSSARGSAAPRRPALNFATPLQ